MDKYVNCTNCKFFRLCDEGLPYCCYENDCNINDCEDSKTLKERPFYRENVKIKGGRKDGKEQNIKHR